MCQSDETDDDYDIGERLPQSLGIRELRDTRNRIVFTHCSPTNRHTALIALSHKDFRRFFPCAFSSSVDSAVVFSTSNGCSPSVFRSKKALFF